MTVLTALLAMLLAAPGGQDASGPELQARLEPDSLTIGGRLRLTLVLDGAGDAVVTFPQLPDSGPVTALGPPRVLSDAPTGARVATYRLAVWRVGEVPLPAAHVLLEREGEERRLPLPELSVTVMSVLPAGADADTLAWKPPRDVAGSNWSLLEKLAGALLMLALLSALVVFLRRRSAAGQPVPRPPPRPPRARALEALDRLAESGLVEVREFKAFYSALSAILRGFLAEVGSDWGRDLTTSELLASVGADGVSRRAARMLRKVLEEADLVKFAREEVTVGRAKLALERTRSWIEDFEPRTSQPAAALEGPDVSPSGPSPDSPGDGTAPPEVGEASSDPDDRSGGEEGS